MLGKSFIIALTFLFFSSCNDDVQEINSPFPFGLGDKFKVEFRKRDSTYYLIEIGIDTTIFHEGDTLQRTGTGNNGLKLSHWTVFKKGRVAQEIAEWYLDSLDIRNYK